MDAYEAPDIAAAVERTLATETAGLNVFVSLDVPGQTIEPLVFVDVGGQIGFGAEVRGCFEGEMLGYGAMSVLMEGDDLYVSGDLMRDMLPEGSHLYVDAASAPPGFEELRSSFFLGNDASLALY